MTPQQELNNVRMGGIKREIISIAEMVANGLGYLLTHFEDGFHFPRNISTKETNGGQRRVFSKEAALTSYTNANFLDCRISAYPNQKYKKHIKQKPDFLFLDIDGKNSKDEILRKTLENIKAKFENNDIEPTVLWSGNGYHIYLPVDGVILEYESLFEDIKIYDPSRRFIQWAEQYLTDNKADQCHSKCVSFNNCLLRVPGSINSKVNQEVRIIQRWNGVRPSIRPLLYDFFLDLADNRLMEIRGIRVKEPVSSKKVYAYWKTVK